MTDVNEIADGIYRYQHVRARHRADRLHLQPVPHRRRGAAAVPHRTARMFPLVSEAIATVMPVERLRWIMFGHVESDECGAMNEFLAAAPDAQVAHGALGCMVSINDLADRRAASARARRGARPRRQAGAQPRHAARAPRLGRALDPRGDHEHAVLRRPDEPGRATGPAITGDDLLGAAAQAEDMFHSTCLTPADRARRSGRWPTSRRPASRSCTARRSRVTAARRCGRSPTSTTVASAPTWATPSRRSLTAW